MLCCATIRRSRPPHGITVVEILGLLAIAMILTGLFLERHQAPPEDTPQQAREKCDVAKMFVTRQIDAMLDSYKTNVGRYPLTAEGLWALTEAPPRVSGWQGPYLTPSTMPLDPWGQPYHYTFPDAHNGPNKYDVWSNGPDQTNGTADDIRNW